MHDPEDTSDNVAGSRPPGARMLLTTSAQLSNMETSFYPYPNKASLRLGDWYWNQGALKSKDNFRKLLDIIRSPSFRPDDIQNMKWASIDHFLGTLVTDKDLHNQQSGLITMLDGYAQLSPFLCPFPNGLQILDQKIIKFLTSTITRFFLSFVRGS